MRSLPSAAMSVALSAAGAKRALSSAQATGMLHVYPMLPVPQARRARRKVVAAIMG